MREHTIPDIFFWVMDFSFGREHRLTRQRDIERLFREGRKLEGRLFSFRVRWKEDPNPRLLAVVGKKVGKAVVRNRVKRGIREGFRHHKELFKHLDVAVIARPEVACLQPGAIAEEWVREFQEVYDGARNGANTGGF
ncbi:MAG: ribonuclease P protein component [Candidatus Bipolaricaulota bacterium]|nr:ribonuclease P protein component [Candidatus Bipolaricaulota bacterium]MDW8126884.1 ribonuclease P protein component [Candidatus Bipolaricaulota bacterium]